MGLKTRWMLLSGVGVLIVASVFFLSTRSKGGEGRVGTYEVAQSPDRGGAASAPPQGVVKTPETGGLGGTMPRGFELKASDFLADSFNKAKSAEEAQWLFRNGYPTLRVRENTKSYFPRDAELTSEAYRDSAVLIGAANRLLRDGGDVQAGRFLHDAAANGSAYASELLAGANVVRGGNPILAAAYYKVAASQGNWAVEANGLTRVSDYRGDMIASLTAQRIEQDFYRIRQEKGLSGTGYDPRPGLAEFVEEAASINLKDKP